MVVVTLSGESVQSVFIAVKPRERVARIRPFMGYLLFEYVTAAPDSRRKSSGRGGLRCGWARMER
jgi:hypothetical protein